MATDVDVQYFSHLNGLTLGNNWGDLICLLDKALVTGIDFTQITAASIDAQGDVHITLYAAHNAMLFQVVELAGFAPTSLNQKYRIKGVPSATELILKPHTAITETSITTVGAGKLASLGYEIIFRDVNDVKRVYRAKNPTAQHPFIRVDESIASGTGSYTSTYAKFAMVGLLENMEHIDDYKNPNVLQLPFNPVNPAKNWKITGTGTGCVRGWSRWYWARQSNVIAEDTGSQSAEAKPFTLCGDKDAFYLIHSQIPSDPYKTLFGCGLYSASLESSVVPNWFLVTKLTSTAASATYTFESEGGNALHVNDSVSSFYACRYLPAARLANHAVASPIMPNMLSGNTEIASATGVPALTVPFYDNQGFLRGGLKHVCYAAKNNSAVQITTPYISDNSMYVWDCAWAAIATIGGFYFYLGELE